MTSNNTTFVGSKESTSEFAGCDGGDPGSLEQPSIWVFGIEHGTYKSRHDPNYHEEREDFNYTIETQLKWPYNQKVFKLLAAIKGFDVGDYKSFAEEYQPFVSMAKGYFKGNIFPYACRNVSDWPPEAAMETGMSKVEYRKWCRLYHFKEILRWVETFNPRIFIGVGVSNRSDFAKAFFGFDVGFQEYAFSINNYNKKIYHNKIGEKILVVVPHLSGTRRGLNSNESIRIAGKFISGLMK
jgi:hypothetical protein